ncbi:ras GEF [Microthyrium microscopicum]|uniref:Ras GEF n=1 Tax=Microthyrium microscopicum TaxID=703497 RepID=A0A6A6UM81_9PEZI|nr:ras GEF [Microthyrium microscopicum]
MSPPLTPRTSKEALPEEQYEPRPESQTESRAEFQTDSQVETTFHHYLRAFYHFHPSSTVSSSGDESSITVPINQGDVILVHSIHPNGWADGSLLTSGARGWLPTNYCEPYDPPEIRTLLNSLTNLWDLVRSPEHESLIVFSRQDYVKGMIAGVRFFLEQTSCLSRDSSLILSHVGLRRLRKGLLSDLSMLVRIAKELQLAVQSDTTQTLVFEQLDELVLKAFKVVERAVRFHDIWSQDVDSESNKALSAQTSINRPPTPPVDNATDEQSTAGAEQHEDSTSHAVSVDSHFTKSSEPALPEMKVDNSLTKNEGGLASPSGSFGQDLSAQSQSAPRPVSISTKRISVSHRLSYIGKGGGGTQKHNLASERLSAAHDSFMGLLGTFIGLHIKSRSSHELAATTHKSVIACRELIAVVEEIWARDGRRTDSLKSARDVMYAKLADLVQTAKDMLATAQNGDDILDPEQGNRLVMTTTNCILAAGDCVSKAKHTIERIGDFEFESSSVGLADQIFGALSRTQSASPSESTVASTAASIADSEATRASFSLVDKPLPVAPGHGPPEPTARPPLPPLKTDSKPLPEPPKHSPLPITESIAEAPLPQASTQSPTRSSGSSIAPAISVLPRIQQDVSPTSSFQSPPLQPSEFSRMPRTDSVNTSTASAADTNSTWRNSMQDGASIVSHTSTRATTPDRSPTHQPNNSLMSNSVGSVSELQSVVSEETGEEQMLDTTFAHELVPSKDGQVLGGSLSALIERLTAHDSTPDATFSTTFYLTFRLFTTPMDFAQGLIDRFDYIGDSHNVGVPVRLRISNVFKGWLETHWQPESDADVLPVITDFAQTKLTLSLPSAGKRILELTTKVSEQQTGTLVPRLVSTLGRTSSSVSVFSSADNQIPSPIMSKSQLNALRQARMGVSQCSILDFDPMELARQFTIIESRIYCSIGPEELLNFEYTKKSESRVANVLAMSTLATDLANLVAESILQFEEPKKRAVMIKQWIKIGMKCLELANYDTLMAIICSINSSVVTRLKRTWELISQKTKTRLEELSAIVECSRNHSVLRERLKNHVAPCIPYVGMYLTDLTFTNAGNPASRELPGVEPKRYVINFDRCMKIAKTIGEVQRFQIPYRLIAVPELQEWMEMQINRVSKSDSANTQSYYRRSLLLEPREASVAQPKTHWYSSYTPNYQPVVVQQQPSHQPTLSQSDAESLSQRDGHSSKESISKDSIGSVKDKFDFQVN